LGEAHEERLKLPAMTKAEMRKFLSGPLIAKVATIRADGSPFLVPVWYEWDGKVCYLVIRQKANWVKNIRREPRVTVLLHNDSPPYQKVIIEGNARIVGDELSDWLEIGKKMVKRYYGPSAGISYLEGSIDQPRFTVKITPTKITTWVNPPASVISKAPRLSWPSRYYSRGTNWFKEFSAQEKKRRGR
jgi:PPOX class probable F420-dependent enzyme